MTAIAVAAAQLLTEYHINEVMSIPESEAKKRWDKENTVFIGLKFVKSTDADILSALDPNRPKQTQIKELIRKSLKAK